MEYLFPAPILNFHTLWLLFEVEDILHNYVLFRHMGLKRPAFIFYVILFKDQFFAVFSLAKMYLIIQNYNYFISDL